MLKFSQICFNLRPDKKDCFGFIEVKYIYYVNEVKAFKFDYIVGKKNPDEIKFNNHYSLKDCCRAVFDFSLKMCKSN